MEAKKISFGFSKITKKPNLLPNKENTKTESKVELIKCLEGQEIKLVEEKPEEKPLVIPLKESHKTSAALASLMKRRAVLLGEDEPQDSPAETNPIDSQATQEEDKEEDIEKRAARELLAEIQKNSSGSDPSSNLVLPVVKPEDLPLDGAKESTLDDYESIPIQDFGKAMLRGMGWSEPPPKNKNGIIDDTPMVRPKGMGLGADKALSKKPLLVAPEANEVLEIKRNAYVRILGGKHKDLYGQIEGFDDHAGRVIVKMAIGGAKEAFNEFLCQPVSRKEYSQYGKCINTSKYEEYKKKENEFGQIILSKDERDSIANRDERKIKEEIKQEEEEDLKYHKKNGDYESKYKDGKESDRRRENDKYGDREDYRERSRNDDRDRESDRRRENGKYSSRDDYRERKTETHRNEERDRDNERRGNERRRDNDKYDRSERYRNEERDRYREAKREDYKREYNRDEDRDYKKESNRDDKGDHSRRDDRIRDYDKYDTKSYRNYEDSRKDYDRNSSYKNYERSSTKDVDRQRERDRDRHKVIEVNDSSSEDNDSDTRSSKHKKSKKSKKKSKKSKKSKSKYKNDSTSSDSETTSSSEEDSSSDSEDEKHKKHKKKSKKNKKQRERSRSRGRR